MISPHHTEALYRFFQDCLSFYKDFLALETEKYSDITANHLENLDRHVKKEEVFMLKARGLEQERVRLLTAAGCPDATFRELIPLAEGSMQPQLEQLFHTLSAVLLEVKEANLRCNYLTDLRLHRIQAELKKLENRPDLQKVYDAAGRESGHGPQFLSKKI